MNWIGSGPLTNPGTGLQRVSCMGGLEPSVYSTVKFYLINLTSYNRDNGVQLTNWPTIEIISLSHFEPPLLSGHLHPPLLSNPLGQSAPFLSETSRHVNFFTMAGSSANAVECR